MDKYGGQMSLCDFGAFLERCPENDNCIGPSGTRYTPQRLYSWNQWIARGYVKDSLTQLFPEKAKEIEEKIDPGEYGLEDYWCRTAAVFIFLLAMMEELLNVCRTVNLLYNLPSKPQDWIVYNGPLEGPDTKVTHQSDIEFKIAGMSL